MRQKRLRGTRWLSWEKKRHFIPIPFFFCLEHRHNVIPGTTYSMRPRHEEKAKRITETRAWHHQTSETTQAASCVVTACKIKKFPYLLLVKFSIACNQEHSSVILWLSPLYSWGNRGSDSSTDLARWRIQVQMCLTPNHEIFPPWLPRSPKKKCLGKRKAWQ